MSIECVSCTFGLSMSAMLRKRPTVRSGAICREGQVLATLAPPHGHNHFHSMFDHEHRKTPIIAAELGSAHLKPAHVAGLAPSLH
jgi:hypothetical protein